MSAKGSSSGLGIAAVVTSKVLFEGFKFVRSLRDGILRRNILAIAMGR